jgi:hypothetical protein
MSATSDPYLSQRLAALALANRIRRERLALLGKVGKKRPAAVVAMLIEAPPACLRTMMVGRIVRRAAGVGDSRARRLLAGATVGERRCLGDLTARERRAIVERLVTR